MFYLGVSKKIETFFKVKWDKIKTREEELKLFKGMNTEHTTSLGYVVVKHGGGLLVKSKITNKFIDLESIRHSWSPEDMHFKDCIGDKNTVEQRFGTINFPEIDSND